MFLTNDDTICALATAPGMGAVAIVRVSGKRAFEVVNTHFKRKYASKQFSLENAKSHTMHLGAFFSGYSTLDEVLVAVFKGPNSYTGENVVEINCHGSVFVQQQILKTLVGAGCRLANGGEFTLRAFLNSKMDLSQAEAVADLINSDSEAAHTLALQQMRGGFSHDIAELREKLINFAALIELELDFSEEDVEFADRSALRELIVAIQNRLKKLIDSFASGNVLKAGVPVAIIGKPNAGKSTLLNALLNEDRAIVSDIAGTTRDTVEEDFIIDGVKFRFIDTAGIRSTDDKVEAIGIEKTFEKINQAALVLYLFDLVHDDAALVKEDIALIRNKMGQQSKPLIVVGNKLDSNSAHHLENELAGTENLVLISAKTQLNLGQLQAKLVSFIDLGILNGDATVVSNLRHFEAFTNAYESLQAVLFGLDARTTGDFLAMDIRKALHHLGEVTGAIDVDKDILGAIFSKFCIGK